MEIITVVNGLLDTNTYILHNGEKAIIIDAGEDYDKICAELKKHNLTCESVLLTHAHFDHANSALFFQRAGAKIFLHRQDEVLVNTSGNLAAACGLTFNWFAPDVFIDGESETLELLGEKIIAIHTPGHTAGGVCYIYKKTIFSGDTLFKLSVGRTDFPTGSQAALARSIRGKLFSLDGDYDILSGHGERTTLSCERENNIYA